MQNCTLGTKLNGPVIKVRIKRKVAKGRDLTTAVPPPSPNMAFLLQRNCGYIREVAIGKRK